MSRGPSRALVLRDLLPPAGPRDLLPAGMLIEFAALADRLGYAGVWVPEGRGRELGATLGAMVSATRRIGLASGIMPLYSRPPALVAMMAATLADLSGGRFTLGIGAGHPAIIEDGYGLRYRQPLRAAREFVAIVRAALGGGPIGLPGTVFRVGAFQLEAPPRYEVPIYLAALGPGMLRLAGEIADGVVLNWMSPQRVRAAVDAVREGCRAAGRDPAGVRLVCFVRAAVTDDEGAGWAVLRRLAAAYAAMPAYARMFRASGYEADITAMMAAWASGGLDGAASAMTDGFLRSLGVVGTAEACREYLDRYDDAGADVVAAYPFPVGPDAVASMRASIDALSPGQ